uniref:Uncharacterized protein n=1 Tax=Arundo donax TaxID=35708 RepID=A0A0A9G5H3_ARUDO
MSCKGGAGRQAACSNGICSWGSNGSHLLAVRVVVIEQRRRREHRVAVLQQLRPEAVLVLLVVVLGVRRGRGGVELVIRRGDGAHENSVGRRGRATGAQPLRGAVQVGGSISAGAGSVEVFGAVLGGVGVAAGELLHEGAEARSARLDSHGVGDVHHLDRLLAVSLVLPRRRRRAAAPAPAPAPGTGSIAPRTALLPLLLLVVH